MPISPEKEEKVKAYITRALDRGFSLSAIEQKLREAGYRQEDIAQISKSFAAPERDTARHARRKFLLILLGIAIAVAALLAAWQFAPAGGARDCGEDTDCFLAAANNCETATVRTGEDGSIAEHRAEGCRYTRTMVQLGQDEPAEVRALLEGKSLQCDYAEGDFNSDWITTISLSLENCSGELKGAIDAVVNAQRELGII